MFKASWNDQQKCPRPGKDGSRGDDSLFTGMGVREQWRVPETESSERGAEGEGVQWEV